MANVVSAPRAFRDPRVVLLREGVPARAIAEAAREALLAFAHGAGRSWTKRDLGEWLAGPYRHLTSFAAGDDAPPSRRPSSRKMRAAPRIAAAEKIDSLLSGARDEILATLMMASPPTADLSFTEAASLAGHVRRSRDADRGAGWVPVDVPCMSLAERVLSLMAVDCLMRPADYFALLSVCGRCQTVAFDAQGRTHADCTTLV